MSKLNKKKELKRSDIIYRILVIIAAIALVVYFMPRESRTAYQFDLGRPWRYSQLIATFDFPIYKSDEAIQKEQDSVMHFFEPYFEFNNTIETEQIEKFRKDFPNMMKLGVPAYYKNYLEQKLHTVFSRGVIGLDDYNRLQKDSVSAIRIFAENESRVCGMEQVFSHKTAYEYLLENNDTLLYSKYKLQRCNLDKYIVPNLVFDEQKSEEQRKELIASVSYANGMVLSGQKIIDRGEIVTRDKYNILVSFQKESDRRIDTTNQRIYLLLGQITCVTIILMCLMLYFSLFRRDYMGQGKSILLLLFMLVIFPITSSVLVDQELFSVYMIPFSMAPIFIRVFMDSRTAFVTHVAIVLLSAISLKYPYEFISTQLVSGMVAIYSLRELSQRSQLLRTALIVTLTGMLFYLGLDLMHEKEFTHIDYRTYLYLAINGILLLFAYPLLFLLEKTFGFTSNVTLVELSNINNEIMRKMSEVAPGTFQHSMQVANLAAEVANKIGAKSQLVRTGALYHDIGKTCNPAFFTENQSSVNPHDHLAYDDSAKIIISHVTDGLKLADKYNLPESIKGFIATHHGKGKTKYFYISYKNKYPNEPIDESIFTYPGPNPYTLEQAILMMADAVEASSRSLKEYTEESIGQLVEKIIDSQVEDGAFKECPITFLDITTAKEVFKEKLKIIYHTRISYPELHNKTKTEPETTTDKPENTIQEPTAEEKAESTENAPAEKKEQELKTVLEEKTAEQEQEKKERIAALEKLLAEKKEKDNGLWKGITYDDENDKPNS